MKKNLKFVCLLLTGCILAASCSQEARAPKKLPILGLKDVVERQENGQTVEDTVYHTIPEFSFVDQDSQEISLATVRGKIYVADFFFTSCPTICPKMKVQMARLHDAFLDNDQLLLLSHTIDPKRDSVAVLKAFADKMDIQTRKWHLVTGDKDKIYDQAEAYMVSAMEDPKAPGGFIHSGAFILIDREGRIRGYYDGTDPEAVDLLIADIKLLLNETP